MKNNAPKSIKGDYDLVIHGNKIVLVDNKDGTTVESKCHPDDDFDIGEGIKEAFKKLNIKREEEKKRLEEEKKIKVGDRVKIIKPEKSYSFYADFFELNKKMNYASRFRFGVSPRNEIEGEVLFITKDGICVIRIDKDLCYGEKNEFLNCYNSIYLMDITGLQKVK